MTDEPMIPENQLQLHIYIDEDGELNASYGYHLGDGIEGDAADFYRRIIEGLMIVLATSPEMLLKASLDADYIEYLRSQKSEMDEEVKDEPPMYSGDTISLEQFKKMKTRGEG